MITTIKMISNNYILSIVLVICLLVVSSCSEGSKDQSLREQTIKELKLPATISFLDTDTSNIEFLNQELCNQLNSINKSQHQNASKINFNYQEKWNIGYRIKSDKDFDIMVVEQGKDSKVKCLITISKQKPVRIISSIIVALDNYKEAKGVLEAENWTSEISPDLVVKVNKHYEKILNDDEVESKGANVANNQDLYKILADGKIEIVSKNEASKQDSIILKKYSTVIIFMNKPTDEAPQLSEDWLLFNTEVENFCTSSGIQAQYCYDNFENVAILNIKKKQIAKINIQKFVDQYGSGYLLTSDDTQPLYVPFGPSEETIKYIRQYFQIVTE
ncbi:MAG: hypothetical protein WCP69_05305 [Bacteroidota bacterium]